MSGRILIAIIAFAAGGAAVYGFQMVSENMEPQIGQEGEMRIAELEGKLGVLQKKVAELSDAQHNADLDTDALSSRFSLLGEKFSQLEKKRGKSESNAPELESSKSPTRGNMGQNLPGIEANRRITGEELTRALKEMSEGDRQVLREAIREEIQRVRTEEAGFETKEELAKKAVASIKSLSAALSLTPVQVEQTRDIVSRQVEKILETQKTAKERGDLEYARTERVKLRHEAERELVEILTPAQLDKLRELDPEGFGKRYPRGF